MRRYYPILFVLILPLAFSISPSSATITAVVGPDGVANVREEYLFVFHDANEMNTFLEMADQMGNSYQLWIARIPELQHHFGKAYADLSNITLYWGEVGPNVVKLTVRYSTKIAALASETSTEWEYMINRFNLPRQGGAFVIPEGVSVVVILPQRARIISYAPALDEAHRAPNILTWEGPITTNDIYVRYAIPKPAGAPSIVELLSSTSYNIYISIIFVVLAAIIFLRREEISQRIQGYVEENSEFEK